ncbi:MAG: HEAT repeat domain-containing protein [Bacteroidota bacterium]
MEREEIEELVAEYISGDMPPARKKQLLQLFESDPVLKREAEEMLVAWQLLDGAKTAVDSQADAQFYVMLNNEKTNNGNPKIIKLNWLINIAASIILAVIAFVLGRQTTPVKTSFVTKTIVVKQPAPAAQIITKTVYVKPDARPSPKAARKPVPEMNDKAQQSAWSVYPSERLAAIMKIAQKPQLNTADLDQLTLVLKEDPSPNVRLATIDLLRPMAGQKNVQAVLISALNDQGDGAVQASIVDILLDNRLKQAIPQMVNLLQNKNTTAMVQDKIKTGIESFLN